MTELQLADGSVDDPLVVVIEVDEPSLFKWEGTAWPLLKGEGIPGPLWTSGNSFWNCFEPGMQWKIE